MDGQSIHPYLGYYTQTLFLAALYLFAFRIRLYIYFTAVLNLDHNKWPVTELLKEIVNEANKLVVIYCLAKSKTIYVTVNILI